MNTSHFLAGLVVATGILATPAIASDEFLRFDGAIGVITVGGIANGAPVLNTVRGIPPGGRPWVLREFKAKVSEAIAAAERGEAVTITKYGKAVVDLVPTKAKKAKFDFAAADAYLKEHGLDKIEVDLWPPEFDNPAYSRKVLGLED